MRVGVESSNDPNESILAQMMKQLRAQKKQIDDLNFKLEKAQLA